MYILTIFSIIWAPTSFRKRSNWAIIVENLKVGSAELPVNFDLEFRAWLSKMTFSWLNSVERQYCTWQFKVCMMDQIWKIWGSSPPLFFNSSILCLSIIIQTFFSNRKTFFYIRNFETENIAQIRCSNASKVIISKSMASTICSPLPRSDSHCVKWLTFLKWRHFPNNFDHLLVNSGWWRHFY